MRNVLWHRHQDVDGGVDDEGEVVEVDEVVHPPGEDDLAVDGQLDALVQVDDCPKQTNIPQSCDEAESDDKTRLLAPTYNNNLD
jgi:hypothetical protein